MNVRLHSVEKVLPGRRRFLRRFSTALVGAPAVYWLARPALAWTSAQRNPTPQQVLDEGPADAQWRIVMVSPDEPGEPMVIRGTIYGSDGRTPLPGARLYVYHTDARGYYRPDQDWGKPARLRGWMKTNAQGQYEFRTIKPAPYPDRTIPTHIHPTADAPGYPARWLDEYWFDGDPFLKKEDIEKNAALGPFSAIVKLARVADGVLHGVRDIRLT